MTKGFYVTYRAHRRAVQRTWLRFAPSREAAVDSARRALDEEFHGAAVLLDVEPADGVNETTAERLGFTPEQVRELEQLLGVQEAA